MTEKLPAEIQRWTARRRALLVLSLLRKESTAKELARKHGLTESEITEWKKRFLAAGQDALRSRPRNEDALKEAQIKKMKQKIGEMVLEMDLLKEALRGRPLDPRAADE